MTTEKYKHLQLKSLKGEFSYVLFDDCSQSHTASQILDSKNEDYFSFKFDGEFALICSSSCVSFDFKEINRNWIGLRIVGDMPFGSVKGLISQISAILIERNIGVCVVSTFLTDVFFLKAENAINAFEILRERGWFVS